MSLGQSSSFPKFSATDTAIGFYVKTMSADGGHFEPRSGSLNTILEVDHIRAIDDMYAILAY
jgi:hypothetical protein